MKKIVVLFLIIFSFFESFSQKQNINDYKYFVLESRFDFLKKRDQYKTSSLTKFLFEEEGFNVYFNDEELPNLVKENRCNSLYISVIDESRLLTIKSRILIKDCSNKILFKSKIGSSKIKDYARAYNQTIRLAFKTVKELNYKYTGDITTDTVEDNTLKKESEIITLYAQPKNNGFQLINSKPEVVMYILKTNKEDVFIIKDKNGILYKRNGAWFAEYYENDTLIKKAYQIKF